MDIGTKVVILTPLKGVPAEQFEAAHIYKALSRSQEISFCTPVKAPELLALFSKAFGDANELYSKIELQYNLCDEQIKKRTAVLVLDEMAEIIVKKGHSSAKSPTGTAEIREAVVDGDNELSQFRTTQIFLKCLMTLWGGHRRKLEMDHGSVKKILERGMMNRDLSVPYGGDSSSVEMHTRGTNNQALSGNPDPDF